MISLTRSMGVKVLAIAPLTPPAAKSFKKAAPSDMILGLNDEKKEKKVSEGLE